MEGQSEKTLQLVGEELTAEGFVVKPLVKGCGIGIDCNDPNFKLVAGKVADDADHQNACLAAVTTATSMGMTHWGTSMDTSNKNDLEKTKAEAVSTCEELISNIPPFEEDSGFAEADSESIDFSGTFSFENASAPGEMSFRVSVQREDGESGAGAKTYVMLASTTYMQ
jgi:hypothetical protein